MSENEITPDDITPQFDDEVEKSLFSQAQDGLAADNFMNSTVGRLVVEASQKRVNDISAELIKAKIEDVPELQIQARIAVEAIDWIVSAVAQGDLAYQQLQEIERAN